jgi:hypothetical protein
MDPRKCQTTAASPAEPGELPFWLANQTNRRSEDCSPHPWGSCFAPGFACPNSLPADLCRNPETKDSGAYHIHVAWMPALHAGMTD